MPACRPPAPGSRRSDAEYRPCLSPALVLLGGGLSLGVMRGQKRVEDARKRAYDPRIHLLKTMDCIGTRACPSSVILGAASRVNPTCGVKPGNDPEGGFDNDKGRFVAFGRCGRAFRSPRSRARAHTYLKATVS